MNKHYCILNWTNNLVLTLGVLGFKRAEELAPCCLCDKFKTRAFGSLL